MVCDFFQGANIEGKSEFINIGVKKKGGKVEKQLFFCFFAHHSEGLGN